jgi:putative ABC transport system permease protein
VNADPGYDPSGLLTFQLPNLNRQTAEARRAFTADLKQRLEALPGVQSVTAASPLPLDGDVSNARWGTQAAAADPSLFQQANVHFVQPGYFETMKTRLVEGRVFTQADNVENLRVTVVDVRLARKAFPGRSAVGERLLMRLGGPEPDMWEIIGVVEHQRHETLAAAGREAVVVTDGYFGFGNAGTWVLRTSGDPPALAQAARSTVQELDRSLPIADMQPMQTYVDKARAPTRFSLVLIGVFAVIAVVLAAVGLYGVLATLVRQRTAEIGVRMALGAPSKSILGLVVGQGIRLSIAGIVVGLAAAVGLTRLMSSMLVDVGATDPVTFAAVSLLFLGIALVACWIPARRASRLDPNAALRME